jgi:hypothetical protein
MPRDPREAGLSKLPARLITDGQSFAIQVGVDALVATEVKRSPKKLSLRQRLIEIQDVFGYESDPMALSRMINPDAPNDREIRKFLSRRGIRKTEYELIRARFDDFFVLAKMLKKAFPGEYATTDRKAVLFATNRTILEKTGVNAFQTNTHLLVDALEQTIGFHNSQQPKESGYF